MLRGTWNFPTRGQPPPNPWEKSTGSRRQNRAVLRTCSSTTPSTCAFTPSNHPPCRSPPTLSLTPDPVARVPLHLLHGAWAWQWPCYTAHATWTRQVDSAIEREAWYTCSCALLLSQDALHNATTTRFEDALLDVHEADFARCVDIAPTGLYRD